MLGTCKEKTFFSSEFFNLKTWPMFCVFTSMDCVRRPIRPGTEFTFSLEEYTTTNLSLLKNKN